MRGDTTVTIDGKQYTVERTFGGSPAIYYIDPAEVPFEHVSEHRPDESDTIVIVCIRQSLLGSE